MTGSDSTTEAFAKLLDDKALVSALNNLGFTEATTVQTLTIPPALSGKDLVVQASTGSGKTLAFGLPLLSILKEVEQKEKVDYTFGLVVTPTRELAVQIVEVFSSINSSLAPVLLIGGMPYKRQQNALKKDPRIIVGTPGRILDFVQQKYVSLKECELFVLDEADEMFSMGFFEDVERIIKMIPQEAQGLFVSATISPRIEMLAKRYLKEPTKIEGGMHEEEPPQIEHLFFRVGSEVVDKPNALCDLLEELQPESAIVFCNTKSETELVEVFLKRRGFDAAKLNSDLNQNKRNKIMEKIRSGKLRYLIATDIAARGIDIAQIELVVNFGIPEQSESYVHRTGRTGRAGRSGKAVSLVGALDFMNFKSLQRELDVDLEELKIS